MRMFGLLLVLVLTTTEITFGEDQQRSDVPLPGFATDGSYIYSKPSGIAADAPTRQNGANDRDWSTIARGNEFFRTGKSGAAILQWQSVLKNADATVERCARLNCGIAEMGRGNFEASVKYLVPTVPSLDLPRLSPLVRSHAHDSCLLLAAAHHHSGKHHAALRYAKMAKHVFFDSSLCGVFDATKSAAIDRFILSVEAAANDEE